MLSQRTETALLLAYIIFANTSTIVLLRLWGELSPHYSYFLALVWALIFAAVFNIVNYVTFKFIPQQQQSLERYPETEQRQTSTILVQLAVALLYCINFSCVAWANPHLRGPVQVVLSQTPIAAAVVVSSLVWHEQYDRLSWMGCLAVTIGCLLAGVVPHILNTRSAQQAEASVGNAFLYVLGSLPLGIIPLLYERYFRRRLLQSLARTSIYLLFCILLMFPTFWAAAGDSPVAALEKMKSALLCSAESRDECTLGTLALIGSGVCAALNVHAQARMSVNRTGTLAAMAMALSPFLADLIFALRFLMGRHYREVASLWSVLGALLAAFGVSLFTFREQKKKRAAEERQFLDQLLAGSADYEDSASFEASHLLT